MLKGLIFDFDGLILDTETPAYHAWVKIYSQFGCTLPLNLWKSSIGTNDQYFDPLTYLHSISHEVINDKEIVGVYKEIVEELVLKEQILPGIFGLLKAAQKRRYKLAVASSSPIAWVKKYCILFGINDFINCYATKEDVIHTKPEPDLYIMALKKLGLDPNSVIALEDSPSGVQAAKKACIFTIAIPSSLTQQLDFSAADMVVTSALSIKLEQLSKLFNKFNAF
jgi:putative hydrolase of the HAD superfamily